MFETHMETIGRNRVIVAKNESSSGKKRQDSGADQEEADDKKYLTPRVINPIKKVQRIYMG